MSRYSRHISLKEIGIVGQDKINASKVLVIGAGGLGCPILQYLVAAGVGTIGIVDFDVVDVSNLQRQILFGTSSIGKNKAEVAKDVLHHLNPTININAYSKKLTPKTVVSIIKPYDIVVDATDNFASRYLINDATVLLEKPLVYGAIYKFEGQVTVFNYKNGPSYRCVFPNPPQKGTMPNCSEVGVLGVLPGIIGTMQANEVLKIILNIGKTLSGKLYCFNALTNQSNIIGVSRNEDQITMVKNRGPHFEVLDDAFFCASNTSEITIENTINQDIQYIDVRELNEQPRMTFSDLLEIPLGELSNKIETISKHKKIVVFCQSGIRSHQAVSLLKEHNISNCYSLKQGVSAFEELGNTEVYAERSRSNKTVSKTK